MLTKDDLEQLREVVRDEVKTEIEAALKPVKRKLNRVAKDLSYIIKTYDEGIVRNRRRIERLEEHVGLSHPE